MTRKYLTVAYTINDLEKFNATEFEHLRELFIKKPATGQEKPDFHITYMSVDYEPKRLELIEQAIEDPDCGDQVDVIRELLNVHDVGDCETWQEAINKGAH